MPESPYSLVISDLHLSEHHPEATERFARFLQTHTGKAAQLFILGDFVEFWIGDDDPAPFNLLLIQLFSDFAQAGTTIYFMAGNRDFLLKNRFAKQCHMQRLPDPYPVNVHGHDIVFMHGDTLCTDDVRYQRYRRIVTNPIVQWIFLRLPLAWRQKIAQSVRQDSKKQHAKHRQAPMIADVTTQAVDKVIGQYHPHYLIHGHTHRMGEHQHGHTTRMVLSDWYQAGSYIKITHNNITLHHWK